MSKHHSNSLGSKRHECRRESCTGSWSSQERLPGGPERGAAGRQASWPWLWPEDRPGRGGLGAAGAGAGAETGLPQPKALLLQDWPWACAPVCAVTAPWNGLPLPSQLYLSSATPLPRCSPPSFVPLPRGTLFSGAAVPGTELRWQCLFPSPLPY